MNPQNPQRRFIDDARFRRPQQPPLNTEQRRPPAQPVQRPQMQMQAPMRPAPTSQLPLRPNPGRPPQPVGKGRHKLRWFAIVMLAIAILALPAWFFLGHKHAGTPGKAGQSGLATGGTASPTTIRLLATGDFIAHDSVNAAAKQSDGSYNYLPMMNDFLPIFKQADIRFCNDPILNGGTKYGIYGYPKFNSPTDFVTDMGRLGCNLANTASNHSFDFTQDNINASVQACRPSRSSWRAKKTADQRSPQTA